VSDKATIIRRLEAALAHALDELEQAEHRLGSARYQFQPGRRDEIVHLTGYVAGLKQALNLCKEPTQ